MAEDDVAITRLVPWGVELLRIPRMRHSFARHSHEVLALGVIDRGIGRFWCEGRTYDAPPESLVLLNPGDVHTGDVARGQPFLAYRMTYIPMAVVAELLAFPDETSNVLRCPAPYAPAIAAMAREAHRCLSAPLSRLEHESVLLRLLRTVFHEYASQRLARVRHRETAFEPGRMARVRDFIHANASADLPLIRLSELVDLSPSYVTRLFRERFGLPPHAYQLQVRLDRGKALLPSGAPISYIASELGFADQAHFTRAFKRVYGVTPGRYQRLVAGTKR